MSVNKFRIYILTGAFAAVTATGAWYGAGLKTQQEVSQERQVIHQASIEDRIEQLEIAKRKLLDSKTELQKKIDELAAKSNEQLQSNAKVQGR